MRISMIVCMARNRTIGRGGSMPWHMPSDLRHFRSVTMGKPVIMGRKTFQSIGRPLPGRTNYVVSRQAGLVIPGVTVVLQVADALAAAEAAGATEAMILGGGEIYAQVLAQTDRIYATELHVDIVGDTAFPALDPSVWQASARVPLATGSKDDYLADTLVYDRRR
jgi:dihydrofolate reductase